MASSRAEVVCQLQFCLGFGTHEALSAASLCLVALNRNKAGVVLRIKVPYCTLFCSVTCRKCMRLKERLTQVYSFTFAIEISLQPYLLLLIILSVGYLAYISQDI